MSVIHIYSFFATHLFIKKNMWQEAHRPLLSLFKEYMYKNNNGCIINPLYNSNQYFVSWYTSLRSYIILIPPPLSLVASPFQFLTDFFKKHNYTYLGSIFCIRSFNKILLPFNKYIHWLFPIYLVLLYDLFGNALAQEHLHRG